MQKLLEVRDLRVQFGAAAGTVTAVDGISFDLHRGETLGIVGETGSGKSVTALSVMRLLGPEAGISGQINLQAGDGEAGPADLLGLPEGVMRRIRGKRIAMIFQEPMTSLNPVLRCGKQVDEAIRLHQGFGAAEARRRTLELFDRVRLSDAARIYRAYPHQLSGGQKQRVMIAMALSCNPDILIADEPTTALDVTVQQSILELMKELRRAWNGATLFITHDLGVLAEIADRVLVMQEGAIVERGELKEVFLNPRHPYTRGLLACRPPLDYRPRRLPVVSDFMAADGSEPAGNNPGNVIDRQDITERLAALVRQEPLLSIRDLKVWFPGPRSLWGKKEAPVKAVDGVSFDVFPGETLGLVGESGCGKTTLGRSLLHLIRPSGGSIHYGGRALDGLSPAAWKPLRREMQIIFQDPYASLNPRRRAGEVLIEPMRVHGLLDNEHQRRERALELLEAVRLEARHFHRYPHEFSGGQRQRLCIARALAVEPRFLICDESVSALDVSIQAQVLNLLMDLREKYRLTMIFISHDLAVVKVMSDRLMVMNQGKIEEIGAAEEIYENPGSEYTRRLIGAIPGGNRKLEAGSRNS